MNQNEGYILGRFETYLQNLDTGFFLNYVSYTKVISMNAGMHRVYNYLK